MPAIELPPKAFNPSVFPALQSKEEEEEEEAQERRDFVEKLVIKRAQLGE